VSRAAVAFERLAIAVAALALSVGLLALLTGYFTRHDASGVSGTTSVPGQTYPDLGHRHLRHGQARAAYNSNPPTSGAHRVAAVTQDGTRLSDDQILTALESGDVVIVYPPGGPPAGLQQLAGRLASPFTPALSAAGQAVILAQRPGTTGLVALAWAHLLRVRSARDPALSQFTSFWLGHGAPSRCC
jgi:hypothetical protein